MADKVLIIAKSGSGKTASMRNMNPEETVVIQVVNKRLPFPEAKNWKLWDKDSASGSRIHLTNPETIKQFMIKAIESGKKAIIVDDVVYLMANKVMAEVENKEWDKWTYLAKEIFDLFKFPDTLPDDVTVYFLTHTEEDQNGNLKMKTAGKLLDNLITPEGMFTMVLGAEMKDGEYKFKVNKERNAEPFKSPMGMFDGIYVDNDLNIVHNTIDNYYNG